MVRRLLDAKHDVGVYNRTPKRRSRWPMPAPRSSARSPTRRATATSMYTMLADDAALEDVVFRQGLLDALPKGGIHVCAGTHGIPVIRKLKDAHAEQGSDLSPPR